MLNTPDVFERFKYSNVLKIINIHHYANDTECSKSFHFACELTKMLSKQGEKQTRLTQFDFTVKVISSNISILRNVCKSQRMK